MNISKEHIRFERSSSEKDFKKDLGIGRIYQIEKWFSDLGYSSDKYIIDKDFNIKVKRHLDLRGTNITSLPNNLNVGRDIWLDKDRRNKIYVPEYLKEKVKYENE